MERDFPGGPVAGIPHSQQRGPGMDPWSGNWIPQTATKKDSPCCKEDGRSRMQKLGPSEAKKYICIKKKKTSEWKGPLGTPAFRYS